ncbi:hypothetical protein CMUS01_12827 [Colletotrichum musicola]|uniref:Uncharacterized protein n=1 Tax=Colletotrichum musicola TaxID=2175873 RepID=A0A8H6JHX1_9PEZI|nr:hypothetical protein CMUS01_12827 [Colletotrichum musicola]
MAPALRRRAGESSGSAQNRIDEDESSGEETPLTPSEIRAATRLLKSIVQARPVRGSLDKGKGKAREEPEPMGKKRSFVPINPEKATKTTAEDSSGERSLEEGEIRESPKKKQRRSVSPSNSWSTTGSLSTAKSKSPPSYVVSPTADETNATSAEVITAAIEREALAYAQEKASVAAQAQKKSSVATQSKPSRSAPTSIPKPVITAASFVEDPTARIPPSTADINMVALIDEENKRSALDTPWQIPLPHDMHPQANIRSVERLEQLLNVKVWVDYFPSRIMIDLTKKQRMLQAYDPSYVEDHLALRWKAWAVLYSWTFEVELSRRDKSMAPIDAVSFAREWLMTEGLEAKQFVLDEHRARGQLDDDPDGAEDALQAKRLR